MKKIRAFFGLIVVMLLALCSVVVNTLKVAHAEQTGAVDLNRLMWLGAGAGSKGIVAGMVSGLAPEAGIAPEIGSAFIGFWLAQQGGRWMAPFGEGMLIAAIGQMVRQPIESIFGRIGGGGATPTPTPEQKAASTASPSNDVDAYLARTYGIV